MSQTVQRLADAPPGFDSQKPQCNNALDFG